MTDPAPSARAVARALAQLAAAIDGSLHLDALHQSLYATDASMYAERPLGVVYPTGREDLVAIVRCAAEHGFPLIPRAAGTSLAGQCVGAGLVVDISRHMTEIIEINAENRWARVQPGVILDELNRRLEPSGLMFGPDTSTSNRCMIGGMIGNSSCGSHSILYGTTRDHVLSLEAVLADGSVVRFGAVSEPELAALEQQDSLEGSIYRTLGRIVSEHRQQILDRFPKPEVVRRNMGYALDYLATTERYVAGGPPRNLARFLCGSEGTLALTTEATLSLVPRPRRRMVVAAHFASLSEALESTVAALDHEPAAVELMDKAILDATTGNLEQQRNRQWVQGDPAAILITELYRDTEAELDRAAQALIDDLRQRGLGYAFVPLRPPESSRAWELRKAGLGVLMGIAGDVKPLTFIEDTAVAVRDLPAYIERIAALLERHGTRCIYYAHASVGELHLRPELNPKDPADIEKMKAIALEVADLLRELRGSVSGEHGDGRVRSPLIERVLGAAVTALLAEVKEAFDPQGIFNPGKIVRPEPLDAQLRYPTGPLPRLATVFAFTLDGDLLRAVERCNGAGACRKLPAAGGTMCPSYQATRDELHSTRGRANALRMALLEQGAAALSSADVARAMELCLSCKACRAECPASVDMARLKAEVRQHCHDAHGTPLRAQAMGQPERGYRLALALGGPLGRWALGTGPAQAVLSRLLGLHPSRQLPPLAGRTLRQQLAARRPRRAPSSTEPEQVALFIDVFTDYHEPHLGLAAVEVLEHAGFEVLVLDHPPSGRAQISQGLLRQARRYAEANVRVFAPLAQAGIPIVGLEPSAILTLVDEHPELVSPALRDDARAVAERAEPVEIFLARRLGDGTVKLPFKHAVATRRVLLHEHCHQKALLGPGVVRRALGAVPGYDVQLIACGCCGMAGSFGYEKEHYELSMQIGEQALFPAVRAASAEALIVAAGTSCRHQIRDGTGRRCLHPIEIFRGAIT